MLLLACIFLVLFVITALCLGLGQAVLTSLQKQQIRKMLKTAEPHVNKRSAALLNPEAIDSPLARALTSLALFHRLKLFLAQSGSGWSLTQFLGFSVLAPAAGALAAFVLPPLSRNPFSPWIVAPLAALLPLLIVRRKRSKRLAAFEEQFPEALNFLSRSMRAGHGFSIGLEMLVADAPEPLRSAFRAALSDLQLGSPLEVALSKLTNAAPLIDVRFFVSAVLLQQGSGGNLGEILDSMAQIIRERVQVKGHVKAASAHGRVTGMILSIMPLAVAVLMFFLAPAYLLVLAVDPIGKKMVIGAACGQMVGYFFIRKIVNFKV